MTFEEKLSVKQRLHTACMQLTMQRIDRIQQAIAEAQQAANDETKSSSGDKYETTRAMMHLEIEKNSIQLQEANKQKELLAKTPTNQVNNQIENGTIVITSQGLFYLAVSAGKVTLDTHTYMCISPATPIGKLLLKQKAGYQFTFQGKIYLIKEIY